MGRDLRGDAIAGGTSLFVAADGPVATGADLDRLVASVDADVAIVVSVGEAATRAFADAAFGTVTGVAGVAVGARPPPGSRLRAALQAHDGATTTVADPTDLGAVGEAVNRHLIDRVGADDRAVVIVNSTTALLAHNPVKRVFYFMHLLIGLVRSRGGVSLFAHDRAQHDTHALATLGELVDGAAAAPGAAGDDGAALALPEPARGDIVLNTLVAYTPALWVLAILTFGMTDIITTYIGIATGLAYEVSPLAAEVFEDHRFGYIYVAKAAVFLLFFLVWRFSPAPYNVSVPLGLFILGVVVTAWNSAVILTGTLG